MYVEGCSFRSVTAVALVFVHLFEICFHLAVGTKASFESHSLHSASNMQAAETIDIVKVTLFQGESLDRGCNNWRMNQKKKCD